MSAFLHVAAAVVDDARGRILIAQRAEHLHQGGLWEFPGGKVEAGETVREALARELHEELGIEVERAHRLIGVRHAYPDRRVFLDVWRVTSFSGEAHGREGQPIRWVTPEELTDYAFPAANIPIIAAARLPPFYLITPDPGSHEQTWPEFFERLQVLVSGEIKLVQLRAPGIDAAAYTRLAQRAVSICRQAGAKLLLNSDTGLALRVGADGVHLSSKRLLELRERPLPKTLWVGASCHKGEELVKAETLGLDFVVLSTVKSTQSHPAAEPMGWPKFAELVTATSTPVYALGGLGRTDLDDAWDNGAQGIAAIRALWEAKEPLLHC